MRITYDPEKWRITLEKRGLDFEDAASMFEGVHYTGPDTRRDYGEKRWISVGLLGGDVVVVVWTERDDSRRVISMRKADKEERRDYARYLDRP